VNDFLRTLRGPVVVSPIGFVSDHLEVVWDLDTEAAATAAAQGLAFARAATPGVDPRFVRMVTDMVRSDTRASRGLGTLPVIQTWGAGCCPVPAWGMGGR